MNRRNFICINSPITIKKPRGKELRTIIQDVSEEAFAVLAPGSGEINLLTGDLVKVACNREDGRYEFTTRVLRYLPGPPPLYYLVYPAEYRRIQVRSHVRVKAALELRYAVWPETDWPHRPPRPHKKAVTVDISGGGAQLVLRESVEAGTLLYLELKLTGPRHHQALRLAGRVKRVTPRQVEGAMHYEAGVAFEGIGEKQEDQIVAFVFQRLLEERRRRS